MMSDRIKPRGRTSIPRTRRPPPSPVSPPPRGPDQPTATPPPLLTFCGYGACRRRQRSRRGGGPSGWRGRGGGGTDYGGWTWAGEGDGTGEGEVVQGLPLLLVGAPVERARPRLRRHPPRHPPRSGLLNACLRFSSGLGFCCSCLFCARFRLLRGCTNHGESWRIRASCVVPIQEEEST